MKSVHKQIWDQTTSRNFDLVLENCSHDVMKLALDNIFDPVSYYDVDVLWLTGISYDLLDKPTNP